MHPLIARIHPAFRTALLAWLLSRSAIWLATADHIRELGTGAPLPGLVTTVVGHLTGPATPAMAAAVVSILPWVILELLMLAAGVAVYRFARTTDLPQIAERVCWLWFFNPILAMTALDWGTQMAAATGALAIAAVVTRRPRIAAVAAVLAVGCRLEFILLWPAVALAAFAHHRRGKDSTTPVALAVLTIPLAFSAWIAMSWYLAGASHTSLRDLHADGVWRDSTNLAPSFPDEVLLLFVLLTALLLVMRYLKRFPLWYALCAVPALLWPFAQVPAHYAAITLAWALPTFVHFGVATDDRAVERPLLASMIIAFVFAAFHL